MRLQIHVRPAVRQSLGNLPETEAQRRLPADPQTRPFLLHRGQDHTTHGLRQRSKGPGKNVHILLFSLSLLSSNAFSNLTSSESCWHASRQRGQDIGKCSRSLSVFDYGRDEYLQPHWSPFSSLLTDRQGGGRTGRQARASARGASRWINTTVLTLQI